MVTKKDKVCVMVFDTNGASDFEDGFYPDGLVLVDTKNEGNELASLHFDINHFDDVTKGNIYDIGNVIKEKAVSYLIKELNLPKQSNYLEAYYVEYPTIVGDDTYWFVEVRLTNQKNSKKLQERIKDTSYEFQDLIEVTENEDYIQPTNFVTRYFVNMLWGYRKY